MPIFVLGSVRSGTSTVVEVLRRYADVACHTEGHLWPVLPKLLSACSGHFEEVAVPIHADRSPSAPLLQAIGLENLSHSILVALYQIVDKQYVGDWVDKTPGHAMIKMAPLLKNIFPSAKFIYCYRDPKSNLNSRMSKFHDQSFESHCVDLAQCWHSWVAIENEIEHCSMVVSQAALRDNYNLTASSIVQFATGKSFRLPPGKPAIVTERTLSEESVATWTAEMTGIYDRHCAFIENIVGLRHDRSPRSAGEGRARRLPMIAGQKGVVLQSAVEPLSQAVFSDIDALGSWIMLHPAPPGFNLTQVTFERFSFRGENKFVTSAELSHQRSDPVRFNLDIRNVKTRKISVHSEIILKGAEIRDWEVEFEVLSGEYDVSLSTEILPGGSSNACAWARLLDPHFLSADPPPSDSAQET